MSEKDVYLKMNDKIKVYLDYILENLTDEQIQTHASIIDDRPIAEVALHSFQVLYDYACLSGGKAKPSFPPIPQTVSELYRAVADLHGKVKAQLQSLPEDIFHKKITVSGEGEVLVMDLLTTGVAHGFYHSGLIGAVRAINGFPTPLE